MIRAAARGVIDFSKARIFDPMWQLRFRLLMKGVGADNDIAFREANHRHALAKLSIANIEPDALDEVQKLTRNVYDDLLSVIRPWQFSSEVQEEREKEEYGGMVRSWGKFFGDPSDPEVAAKIAAVTGGLLARQEQQQAPDHLSTQGVFNRETAGTLDGFRTASSHGSPDKHRK